MYHRNAISAKCYKCRIGYPSGPYGQVGRRQKSRIDIKSLRIKSPSVTYLDILTRTESDPLTCKGVRHLLIRFSLSTRTDSSRWTILTDFGLYRYNRVWLLNHPFKLICTCSIEPSPIFELPKLTRIIVLTRIESAQLSHSCLTLKSLKRV